MDQIRQIEETRLQRLEHSPHEGSHPMVRLLARVIGVGIETADMLVHEILSRNLRDQRAVRAMKAGAIDFLTKPFRHQEMLDAVSTAIERDRKRRQDEKIISNARALFETLTPRERDVLAPVVAGLMNKQIAAEIGVAEITVKIHRGHIMKKMRTRSVADLVRIAEMLGIRRAKASSLQEEIRRCESEKENPARHKVAKADRSNPRPARRSQPIRRPCNRDGYLDGK
jgi:DNA-binding CsgD family transcriptional regulator